MLSLLRYSFVFAGVTVISSCALAQRPGLQSVSFIEKGVSQTLARLRKQTIRDLAYELHFVIPAEKKVPVRATETITFGWEADKIPARNQPLLLDFKEVRASLQNLRVNGVSIPVVFTQEHLVIDASRLRPGRNQIDIGFTAGNLSLNRNDDYLYTLLVPDRARTLFPCFDQPDLKARFHLRLTIPAGWQGMGNAPLVQTISAGESQTLQFAPSEPLPTYLFSFVAGRFTPVSQTPGGRPMTLLHRETDSTKIRLSLTPIFDLHADALRFLEAYTQFPYPFAKFDFAAVPDFQYGGMEHAGAIDYRAASLFLDNGATRDQRLSRATLIAHETAHMWFGGLVTMRWFDDVWLKEVFANFMADKITESSFPDANYALQFLVDHFPAAYAVDRTQGANPIGQPLANLQEAGTLYGGIIYHKAPIMMRQLERLMGKEKLQEGLRAYLKQYAFSNATWSDLIRLLDSRTPADLQAWSRVWVSETGRPVFSYQLQQQQGRISRFTIRQQGEDGSSRVWPQAFEVALVYADRVDELTVNMAQAEVEVTTAMGKEMPLHVIFNASGQGYGRFPIDKALVTNLAAIQNPVTRAAASISLYEAMLAGSGVEPKELMESYRKRLSTEADELNLRLLTGQLSELFWTFTKPAGRAVLAARLETDVWQAMEKAPSPGLRKLLFRLYQSIALSTPAQQRLYAIWDSQTAPAGLTLTEDDYTGLALALAVRDFPGDEILGRQLARIKNPDRQKRLTFMMPALSAKGAERDAFFAGLALEANRDREAWVTAALSYLHHPLRAETSAKYLPQSLELLEEIQRTGDIFFPEQWLRATLGGYQSPAVARLIRQFLADRPAYNLRLRAKLLQAADGTFRASKLLY